MKSITNIRKTPGKKKQSKLYALDYTYILPCPTPAWIILNQWLLQFGCHQQLWLQHVVQSPPRQSKVGYAARDQHAGPGQHDKQPTHGRPQKVYCGNGTKCSMHRICISSFELGTKSLWLDLGVSIRHNLTTRHMDTFLHIPLLEKPSLR